jgi:Transposase DDE domain
MSGEKKYHLTNLPAKADLRTLAATIKARWICEQAHQQLKEELGLDHFEGRSWQGLHRHALMTMIAYAFLQYRRLKTARREKKESTGRRRDRHCRPCARPSSNSSLDHRRSDARTAENGFAAKSSVNKSAKVVLVSGRRSRSIIGGADGFPLRTLHRGRPCVVSTFLFEDPGSTLKGSEKVCKRQFVHEVLGLIVTELTLDPVHEGATLIQGALQGGPLLRFIRHTALRHQEWPQVQ